MLWVPYNQAKTLAAYAPARPDATPTCVIYDPAGGVSEAAPAVTLDTVTATLSVLAALGAQSLTLTSAAGVVVGRRYLVGGGEADGGEAVTVKAVSGSVVSLARPLLLARASGVAFSSARYSFPVAAKTVPGRGYRAEITWASGAVAQHPLTVPFAVTRYDLITHLTVEDVRDLDPGLTKRLPPGLWWPAVVDRAREILERRIVQSREPGSLMGCVDLTTAHGYLVRELLAETAGTDFEAYRALMATRCQQEYESALAGAQWDGDQDGKPDKWATYRRTISMVRG